MGQGCQRGGGGGTLAQSMRRWVFSGHNTRICSFTPPVPMEHLFQVAPLQVQSTV